MTSIRRWLEGLELGQYVETFEKNNIDFDIARDLGDQDLKDLGVTSMGHRKRLFRIDSVSAAPRRCERLLWRSAKVRSGHKGNVQVLHSLIAAFEDEADRRILFFVLR